MVHQTEAAAILAAGAAVGTNVISVDSSSSPFVVVPDGYVVHSIEQTLQHPLRKRASVKTSDAKGFCDYIGIHRQAHSLIYADIDYDAGRFCLVGVLNDHGPGVPGWRDHTCILDRRQSVEWKRWTGKNKSAMSQGDFAAWLEENLADVLSADGMPSGSDMLQMAVGFERTSEKRLKSKINLQSGVLRFEYVDNEDKDTRTSMGVFDRFAIAVPVFDGSNVAYRVDARLRYRDNSRKLSFWFELIRPDRPFRQAVDDEVAMVAKKTGLEIINGRAGL